MNNQASKYGWPIFHITPRLHTNIFTPQQRSTTMYTLSSYGNCVASTSPSSAILHPWCVVQGFASSQGPHNSLVKDHEVTWTGMGFYHCTKRHITVVSPQVAEERTLVDPKIHDMILNSHRRPFTSLEKRLKCYWVT